MEKKVYTMEIAGLKRDLPLCKVNDELYIAAFVMFGDVEITKACAEELLKRAPEYDIMITAESKGIPLLYEMARQSGADNYILARFSGPVGGHEARQHLRGVAPEGIAALAEAPVVEQGALAERIGLHDLVAAETAVEMPAGEALGRDAPKQAVIGAVVVHEVLVAAGDELRGVEAGEQVERYAVLDHAKELGV